MDELFRERKAQHFLIGLELLGKYHLVLIVVVVDLADAVFQVPSYQFQAPGYLSHYAFICCTPLILRLILYL
ncbi:hypothetical protein F4774DRAFT_398794 [Daldinia eschscholtzii]|nr:hypothetical protein F4774DRAFT_398794 [Daldinia eschscholtzii]